MRYRLRVVVVLAAVAALTAAGSVLARNIQGTAKNDTLRGSPAADRINGKGGNDKLYGLAGNDTLLGGPGNDTLTGGPGADTLNCGPGRDTAVGDVNDKKPIGCETVRGIPAPPALSIADASAVEGDSGTKTLSFAVTLSKSYPKMVSVDYATADGTAQAGSDYVGANGTLTFAAGETSKAVEVTVNGDGDVEPNETFTITLSGAVNGTIADGTATGTIENEDRPKPRAGHYAGTTSQGRAISFEVSPDLRTLTNLAFEADFTCIEGYVLTAVPFSGRLSIAPDYSFSLTQSDNEDGVQVNFSFSGSLTAPGSATGRFKIDVTLPTDVGVLHCTTNDTTWNAS
jgi:hypothetical protein